MVTMFSFRDAVHDHLSIGHRDGCIACAQTQADMALSARAYRESQSSPAPAPEVVTPRPLAHVA